MKNYQNTHSHFIPKSSMSFLEQFFLFTRYLSLPTSILEVERKSIALNADLDQGISNI